MYASNHYLVYKIRLCPCNPVPTLKPLIPDYLIFYLHGYHFKESYE